MNFKPLKDRILVERDLGDEVVGGIFLSEKAREVKNSGKVIATGAETRDVKVGDNVLFGKNDGNKVTIEGNDYLLMSETQVYAILGG